MNNKIIAFVLVLLSLAVCSFGQTVSTADHLAPLPVVTSPITTFFSAAQINAVGSMALVIPATPSAAIAMTALPPGCKGFIVCTPGLPVVYGNASVTSGEIAWPTIASSSSKEFYITPLDVTPTIYFNQRTTGATATLNIQAYK